MSELLKLAVLVAVIVGASWFLIETAVRLWEMLDGLAKAASEPTPTGPRHYSYAEQNMRCDACGSAPWHIEWDPESKARKSRKFYCPNCTGAT